MTPRNRKRTSPNVKKRKFLSWMCENHRLHSRNLLWKKFLQKKRVEKWYDTFLSIGNVLSYLDMLGREFNKSDLFEQSRVELSGAEAPNLT